MDTAFGILSTADVCIRYGAKLIKAVQAYRAASQTIADLAIRVDNILVRTEHQIQTLKHIAPNLPAHLQKHFDTALERLYPKLRGALVMLETYRGPIDDEEEGPTERSEDGLNLSGWGKSKLSVFESNVKSIVKDLDTWYQVFDPSWLMISLVANPALNKQLQHIAEPEHSNSPSRTLASIRVAINAARVPGVAWTPPDFTGYGNQIDRAIAGSHILARRFENGETCLIVDKMNPEVQDGPPTRERLVYFTNLLSRIEPETMKLLRCVGFLEASEGFEILYEIPVSLKTPQSLRQLLETENPSLDQRLEMAKSLARAVTSVHALDFVHKNIRPETLLVFTKPKSNHASTTQSPGSSWTQLTAYLAGFEQFRLTTDSTSMVSDMLWDKNLYRHPKRQGQFPEDEYIMQHDIYSLGVCLLEIGVWSSFIYRTSDGAVRPGDTLDIQEQLSLRNKRKAANEVKAKLVTIANELLPSRMGETYTEVVRACLHCLDGDRSEFANLSRESGEDADEYETLAVGVRYIDRILMRLESITLRAEV